MDPDKFLSAKVDFRLNAIYTPPKPKEYINELLIKMFFRFGTNGLYCVTKGNIFLRIFCF